MDRVPGPAAGRAGRRGLASRPLPGALLWRRGLPGVQAEDIRREVRVHSSAQIAAWVTGIGCVPGRLGIPPDGLTGCGRPS
jgi:hypothetical protein